LKISLVFVSDGGLFFGGVAGQWTYFSERVFEFTYENSAG